MISEEKNTCYNIEFNMDYAFNFTDNIPNFNSPIYALEDDLSIIGRDRAYQNVYFVVNEFGNTRYNFLWLHNLNILFYDRKSICLLEHDKFLYAWPSYLFLNFAEKRVHHDWYRLHRHRCLHHRHCWFHPEGDQYF